MFLKSKKFFKKRVRRSSLFYFSKKRIYLTSSKIKLFVFKAVFKKLTKLAKVLKVKTYICFKKNLIISKKSKNSRMGKGKGQNTYNVVFINNSFLDQKNTPTTRFLKIKKKLNYFLKNKIK